MLAGLALYESSNTSAPHAARLASWRPASATVADNAATMRAGSTPQERPTAAAAQALDTLCTPRSESVQPRRASGHAKPRMHSVNDGLPSSSTVTSSAQTARS